MRVFFCSENYLYRQLGDESGESQLARDASNAPSIPSGARVSPRLVIVYTVIGKFVGNSWDP